MAENQNKYLVHLTPSKELSDRILLYRKQIKEYIKNPKRFPHCSLMMLYSGQENEEKIVKSLEGITEKAFDVKSGSLDLFDEDSLVIQLERSSELLGFHKKIMEALKCYINWNETPKLLSEYEHDKERARVYNTYGSLYYADFYNPHITIAQVGQEIFDDEGFNEDFFNDIVWNANEFYLSSKEADKWKVVRKFSLV